ncbi:phage tail protein [Escherichia coli]|uniref:phage tail protein n=1 Tax=Escherichia coli TaxID=562 RepID=UPI0018FE4979|nr:phage tail protein [Escherichia coli]ELP2902986.1 phage tail protein [Escherichia coli O5]EHV0509582.1 phage tail protein [Escherichia coli]EHY9871480.1 phage tail protein [Escherichia coli]EIA0492715.1 phage tail protein [Escherichia coli]EIG4393198.1 phage tail protein [Escherichia coli]
MFQRLCDHITFWASVTTAGIGVMTLSEKIAVAGFVLGTLSLLRAWLHRRRMELAQTKRNELIEKILMQSEGRELNDAERRAMMLLKQDEHDGRT